MGVRTANPVKHVLVLQLGPQGLCMLLGQVNLTEAMLAFAVESAWTHTEGVRDNRAGGPSPAADHHSKHDHDHL